MNSDHTVYTSQVSESDTYSVNEPLYHTSANQSNYDSLECVSADYAMTELHYFWCGNGNFHFRYYLAITAAIQKYQPQIVHFHAPILPRSAPFVFEWYEDLKRNVLFIEFHEHGDARCTNYGVPAEKYISSVVNMQYRNIIVQQDAVVNGRYRHCINHSSDNIVIGGRNTVKYLQAIFSQQNNNKSSWTYIRCNIVKFDSLLSRCEKKMTPSSLCKRNLSTDKELCLQFASDIFVREVPTSKSPVAAFIRNIFYGDANPIYPKKYDHDVIPKVAHYVYLSENSQTYVDMNFGFYLSILSMLGVAKVKCVYIHGNVNFKGIFWNDLTKRNFCVKLHYRPYPRNVWQNQRHWVEHWADVVRAQIFIQYGGLHVDPDVFFYQNIPDNYWQYEAVIGMDAHVAAPGFNGNVPAELSSQVNLGICMSSPGSRYFTLYQETHKNFDAISWWHNSGEKPLQVYERHPDLVFLSTRLEIVCPGGLCYPSWARSHEEAVHLSQNPQYWFSQGIAVHTVWPDMVELSNPKHIWNSTTVYGTIATIILKANNMVLSDVENMT